MQSALVSSEWLAAHLSDPKLVILDASMDKVIGREPIVYDEPALLPVPGGWIWSGSAQICSPVSHTPCRVRPSLPSWCSG